MNTSLYRHYDAEGQLLYVGISLSAAARLAQHARQAQWSKDIFRVDITAFPTRLHALEAERLAIQAERPLWNKKHNGVLVEKPVPVVFPTWRDDQRAMPKIFAASGLFTPAISRGTRSRSMLFDQPIPTLADTMIHMTGEELSQFDGDVLLQLLHLARGQLPAVPIQATANSLLKGMGSCTSSQDYDRLHAAIARLKSTLLRISLDNGKELRCSLLLNRSAAPNVFYLEPLLANLFMPNSFTRLDWPQRKALSPMAKWLHALYSAYPAGFSYKLETLYKLSGSKAATLRTFKPALFAAYQQLQDIGFLTSWTVDGDLVKVKRRTTA